MLTIGVFLVQMLFKDTYYSPCIILTLLTFGSSLPQISLLPVVRLLSLTFVRTTQEVETFGNFDILYLSHPLTPVQNFTEIVPGEPFCRER